MTVPIWPPGLPQRVERGFTESIGINVIRTPNDAGPAKIRRRSTRPSSMSVTMLMTTDQVDILEDFINITLLGTARFEYTHPRTEDTVEVRIVPGQDGTMFNCTYRAPEYWMVSMQWEILP